MFVLIPTVFFLVMAKNKVIDFDEMTYQQKKDLIIKGLLKACNFTDPTATTLDWTSSMSGLHVPATMVLTVLRTLDFDRICSELTGKKIIKEMFKKVFDI